MKSVSLFNRSFNPLGAARRHHKKRNGRPLVAGSGRVIAKGKLGVELPTVDGDIVTYVASPDMVWRFTLDTSARPKVRVLTPEEEEAPLTIEEEEEAAALAEEDLKFLLPTTPVDSIKRSVSAARAVSAARDEFVENRNAVSAVRAISAALDEIATLERRAGSPVAPTILNIAAE